MKGRVLFGLILSICTNWNPIQSAAVSSNDDQSKLSYNSIASTSKPDLLSYQQITHYDHKYHPQHVSYQQQFQPMVRSQQLVQTVPYNHQPESSSKPYNVGKSQSPIAMVIIAQPAYIPASMLQHDNVAQQILQYFHGGSFQSRYHQYQPLQHQSYQPPQPSFTHYMHYQPKQLDFQQKQPDYHQKQLDFQPKPSPDYHQTQFQPMKQPEYQQKQPDYQSKQPEYHQEKQPEYQPETLPTPQALISSQNHPEPTEEITRLAQQAAQHFLQNGGLSSQSRTAPAIITGLELFPAEQQEKIKAQLSEHFGSPLKPLNFEADLQQLQQQQPQKNHRKFYHQERKEKFRPSVEVKDGEITVGRGKM